MGHFPGLLKNVTRTPWRGEKCRKRIERRWEREGVARAIAHPCFKIARQDELHLVCISTDTRCKAFCEQWPLANGVEYGTLSRINETKYSNYRLIRLLSVSRQVFVSMVHATNYPPAREGWRVSKQPWLLLGERNGWFSCPWSAGV